MLPPLSLAPERFRNRVTRRLLLRRGCHERSRASFQRVDSAPVLLPERFRGGCAFGDRKIDSLPERSCYALASPNPKVRQAFWRRERHLAAPVRVPCTRSTDDASAQERTGNFLECIDEVIAIICSEIVRVRTCALMHHPFARERRIKGDGVDDDPRILHGIA